MRKYVPYIVAGFIVGATLGILDGLRKRAESEVWEEAKLPDPVGSAGSGNESADTPNGATADSSLPVP